MVTRTVSRSATKANDKKARKVRSKSSSPSRKVRRAQKKQSNKSRRKPRSGVAAKILSKVDRMAVDAAESGKKLRIGILLTYPRLEVKKEELISHRDKNRAWTKLAEPKFVVERKFRREKKVVKRHPLGKYAIPTDVSVGCFIKHQYPNVEVDMILPHDISKERLGSNDINFLMIYDLLESFHTDKSKDKKVYTELKDCLESCDNIFPPYEYQKLIYSKIEYYNYLKDNKVAIAPTMTLTQEEYNEMGNEAAIKKILDTVEQEQWGRFICKPVYGQEAIDARFFTATMKKSLANYFKRCMKKYPGIVIQKEIKDFGNSKKSPELRMYYVGKQYTYSVCANENTVVRPRQEGGSLDTPLDSLKSKTRKILRKLPPIVMPNGKRLPRLLTRLDMGYLVDGKYSPFVNEVEFVPSLYAEDCAHHPDRLIDAKLGHQMVKIAKLYVK
jgi:hypothetical protein